MRAVVLRSFVVVAASSSVAALALLAACASDDPGGAPTPVLEAGSDALLLGDVIAHDADADIPLGDVCGNNAGLEKDAPWPMHGGCPKAAGVALTVGPQSATVKWSLPLTAGASSPAIDAERLVWVGTADGDVVVVSGNGIVQAALHTGKPVTSSPARSATGLTIVGGTDGALYGIDRFAPAVADAGADAGDGGDAGDLDAGDLDGGDGGGVSLARAVFRLPLGAIASSPAIGADGTLYVSTTTGKLFAITADGSATKWSAPTGDTLGSSPALAADGTIYIGSSDHRLYAFAPDGIPKWSFETGGAIAGSPAVGGDETVYVGSSDGTLYAVGPDGKKRWGYAAGGPISGAPCVRGGVVYVGSDDKALHAVASPTGVRNWVYATLGAVATPVVGADGTVYVGSADGHLYAVTPTGSLFFAVNAKGRIHSAPAVADDGSLYVTTDTALVGIGP